MCSAPSLAVIRREGKRESGGEGIAREKSLEEIGGGRSRAGSRWTNEVEDGRSRVEGGREGGTGDSSCGRLEASRRTACGFLLAHRLDFSPAPRRHARHLIFVPFLLPGIGRGAGWRGAGGEGQESRVLTGCLGRSSRSDVNPICAEYDERGAPPGGRPAGRGGAELVGDNNDLSRRDIMLIRNLQFFLRVCPRPLLSLPPCPLAGSFLPSSSVPRRGAGGSPRTGPGGTPRWISY